VAACRLQQPRHDRNLVPASDVADLALIATLASISLRVATALSEIAAGTIAQLVIGATVGTALLAADAS
jgi:hypothetical protein